MIISIGKALAWFILGGLISLLGFAVFYLENRADLSIWHHAELDEEFTVASEAHNFDDYLAIEGRVFGQLEELIVRQVPVGRQHRLNRFSEGSLSDPDHWPHNWNRSYELTSPSPKAGVLLLHGMSDSPYSLRGIGQRLHQEGAWVLSLRFPGHGTAPAGLEALHWQDMARSIELAMAHLSEKIGDRPIYIIGYSAGGALAVHYALNTIGNKHRAAADGIVLLSPSIGVTPLAALATWQARLGRLLGLDKLQWSDISLEYDPFKYNSFTVNAGEQVYRLTEEISRLLEAHRKTGDLHELPSLLAFQSSIDATVSSRALLEGLFNKLSPNNHELVLFDINRQTTIKQILRHDPKQIIDSIRTEKNLPFTFSVVTNQDEQKSTVHIVRKHEGDGTVEKISTAYRWPESVYSLSHIALPFSRDDKLYGETGSTGRAGIHLGNLALRGERNAVLVTASDMLRLRWNPFYPLIEQKIVNFAQLH